MEPHSRMRRAIAVSVLIGAVFAAGAPVGAGVPVAGSGSVGTPWD